jgi:hypothetical protein
MLLISDAVHDPLTPPAHGPYTCAQPQAPVLREVEVRAVGRPRSGANTLEWGYVTAVRSLHFPESDCAARDAGRRARQFEIHCSREFARSLVARTRRIL